MTEPTPSVSAIMPIYQAEATVERAVRSVLAQTERSFELIVVDDGSTDSGPERVAAIDDPRVRLVRRANAGCGAARNAALARARGRLVAFLDADDEWLPGFFERALRALDAHPGVGFYFADTVELGLGTGTGARAPGFVDPYPTPASEPPARRLDPPPAGGAKAMKRRIDRSLCAMVGSREAVLGLGGYYDRDGCRYGGDSVLAMLIHWNAAVLVQPVPALLRHRLEAGLTRTSRRVPVVRPLVADAGYALARVPAPTRAAAHRLIDYLAVLDATRLARMGHVALGTETLGRASRLARTELAVPLARYALRATTGALRRAPPCPDRPSAAAR